MNGFEVKVTDSIHNVMFTATVSYIYVTAFMPHIRPFTTSIKQVEPGTGNTGKSLEYFATYSGQCMYYTEFRKLMDNIDI